MGNVSIDDIARTAVPTRDDETIYDLPVEQKFNWVQGLVGSMLFAVVVLAGWYFYLEYRPLG